MHVATLKYCERKCKRWTKSLICECSFCYVWYRVDVIDFSSVESCFLIEQYFHMLSTYKVCELFNEKFGNRQLHNTMIIRVVDHFCTHHTISHRKESGERITECTIANWEDVRQRITNDPHQCCQTYRFLHKLADFAHFQHKSADFAFLTFFLWIINNFEWIFLDILYTRIGLYFC